jgi:hypothetical protein
MYTAGFEAIAVSAVQDLFQLLAASNVAVIVHEVRFSQVTVEVSEMVELMMHRGSTNGSGGGTDTPNPNDMSLPAADTTVEINNTTQATNGTLVGFRKEVWQMVHPFLWLPPPEGRVLIPGGDLFHVSLETAPDAETTMSGAILFEELG